MATAIVKKDYYYANRESILQKKREYDSANRERNNLREKLRYLSNKERIKARCSAYHFANKAAANARTKAWHKSHPEESKAAKLNSKAKRRALEYGTRINEYGIRQWMKEVRSKEFARCHWCGTKVHGSQIVFDHVVALSKGGTHTIGNLCACCRSCNSMKKDRELARWIRNGQCFLAL